MQGAFLTAHRLSPVNRTVELTDADTLLILACDGVWDVLSNEHAVAIAESQPTAARAAIALRGSPLECMLSLSAFLTTLSSVPRRRGVLHGFHRQHFRHSASFQRPARVTVPIRSRCAPASTRQSLVEGELSSR